MKGEIINCGWLAGWLVLSDQLSGGVYNFKFEYDR
jgi:hypothetical protein